MATCFQCLVEGTYDEKSLSQLLREELPSAAKVGLASAVAVLAVLVMEGMTATLIAGAAIGAFTLAIVVHELVLVAGVGLLRWTGSHTVQMPSFS